MTGLDYLKIYKMRMGQEPDEVEVDENHCVACGGDKHEELHLVNAEDPNDHVLLPICNICLAKHKRREVVISMGMIEERRPPIFPIPDNMNLEDLQAIGEGGIAKLMIEMGKEEWIKDERLLIMVSMHIRLKKLEHMMGKISNKIIGSIAEDLADTIKEMKEELEKENEQ